MPGRTAEGATVTANGGGGRVMQGEGMTLGNLGIVNAETGRTDLARQILEEALRLLGDSGSRAQREILLRWLRDLQTRDRLVQGLAWPHSPSRSDGSVTATPVPGVAPGDWS